MLKTWEWDYDHLTIRSLVLYRRTHVPIVALVTSVSAAQLYSVGTTRLKPNQASYETKPR
jgi:hypothetical protein